MMKRIFGVAMCLVSLSACASHPRHHRDVSRSAPAADTAALSSFAPAIQQVFKYDADGDHRLDRDEWLDAQWAIFAASYDLDSDGVVTRDEYAQSACKRNPSDATDGFRGMCVQTFLRAEFGKRPQLDKASYRRRADAFFKQTDANHDGYVTPEEMASAASKRR